MKEKISIAVAGATGTVGEALLEVLGEREFPAAQVHLLASSASAGKRVEFGGGYLTVRELEGFDFDGVDIAFFCLPESVSAEHAPRAAEAGCVVIDFAPAAEGVPVVAADLNPGALAEAMKGRRVGSPSPVALTVARVLAPIQRAAGLTRVDLCALLPVSVHGRAGVKALAGETASLLNARPVTPALFPAQIAFNLLADPSPAAEREGYSAGERRAAAELAMLLGAEGLAVVPTFVQAPVFFGQAVVLQLECREPLDADAAGALLAETSGVEWVGGEGEECPSPVADGVGTDAVRVARLRPLLGGGRGLAMWLVADNLRGGAALNGVQIAEVLIKEYL